MKTSQDHNVVLARECSRVEDELGYLSILYGRSVVVAGSIGEMECYGAATLAIHRHLAHTFSAIMRVAALKRKNKMKMLSSASPIINVKSYTM